MSQTPTIPLAVSVAMDTDIGRKRKQNQDAIGHSVPTDPAQLAALGQIFVLADGVGGLTAGDLASQYAVSTIISSYYEQEEGEPGDRLARAIAEANNVIFAQGQDQTPPGRMATTAVCAVVQGRRLIIGSVGDSPAYLMRAASARQLTIDHTVQNAQRQSGTPLADDDPSGRKLVRALGKDAAVKVDIIAGPIRDGDHVVLCSDGLTRYVTPEEIEQVVATRSPDRAVKALIQMANDRGGQDNISVIVLRITEPEPAEAIAPEAAEEEIDPVADYLNITGASLDFDGLSRDGSARARRAARERRAFQAAASDNPIYDVLDMLRSNIVITGIGLAVVAAIFAGIMLFVANMGDDDSDGSSSRPTVPTEYHTTTPDPNGTATAQAAGMQTNDALEAMQAAQAATAAILTLTPPAPSGPQMAKDSWFRVQPGDPVPAFSDPDVNADSVTALEAGAAYLIQEVNSEAWNGPWYWVVDNQGAEARWVNGPSLHQRVLLISPSGEPLPDDQQPTDIAPGVHTPTAPPTPEPATDTPTPSITPLPGVTPTITTTPGTPTPTLEPTYQAEAWQAGMIVYAKDTFLLRDTPSLQGSEGDSVAPGESASVMQGPVSADGHWWWRLRYDDGRSGWVAQPLLSFSPPS